jgi:hypothetical protein
MIIISRRYTSSQLHFIVRSLAGTIKQRIVWNVYTPSVTKRCVPFSRHRFFVDGFAPKRAWAGNQDYARVCRDQRRGAIFSHVQMKRFQRIIISSFYAAGTFTNARYNSFVNTYLLTRFVQFGRIFLFFH